jgi:uncharacterized membrane protein YkgB
MGSSPLQPFYAWPVSCAIVKIVKLQIPDQQIKALANHYFVWAARISIAVVYIWFGVLKFWDLSPAGPLARALVDRTIGATNFDTSYLVLAAFECLIGILFLIPKLTRWAVLLFAAHMAVVCSPVILVPHVAWVKFGAPSLEGQYIIKNLVLMALVLGVVAKDWPITKSDSE